MKQVVPGGGNCFWPRIPLYCAWIGLWLSTTAVIGTPALPIIDTNNVVNITDFGAISSTTLTNTTAIQNAINSAATTNGGCTVKIPAGTYLSGPLTLANNINLQIDSGAILRMLPFGQYPLTYFTNVVGSTTNITWTAPNFISGTSLHDIAISGPGAIDGQGLPWWPYANTNGDTRPIMIRLNGCNRELIQNITLSNSPMFHIAIGGKAGNTTVQGVIIRAPSSSANPPSHNTDACDVSGTNILVQNCDISVGDDNFTCGGGTADVLITNCTFGYGHGLSIGSPTFGGVSNFTVINCTFNNTEQGIRIKSDRDRGGFLHQLKYLNLRMTNVNYPILIYASYAATNREFRALNNLTPAIASTYPRAAVAARTPIYRDITISNLTATVKPGYRAGLIWGLPEMAVSNVLLQDVTITADKPFGVYEAANVRFENCRIITPEGTNQISSTNARVQVIPR